MLPLKPKNGRPLNTRGLRVTYNGLHPWTRRLIVATFALTIAFLVMTGDRIVANFMGHHSPHSTTSSLLISLGILLFLVRVLIRQMIRALKA